MKTLKFTIPILIAAVSLLIISGGIIGDTQATSSSAVNHTPVAQAKIPPSSSTDLDEQWVENDSVPPTQSEVLILNDPYLDEQWALSQIQMSELWQITTGNSEILVAVLDTGIDRNHEDLKGKVAVEINFTDSLTPGDVYGHGTHIAGIIAASGDNGTGIVGMAPDSRLINVKIADDKGRCQASAVARGIIWAVNNGANVINISVELEKPSLELESAVNYAWSRGVVIITAAGNEGSQSPVYPAYYENCIAVAAIKQDDNLAPLSNHGDWVDMAAPGFNIYSTLPDNSYGYKSGTSFAAAYVSGIAALLFDAVIDTNGNGRLNDEVRAAIEAGCQEIGIRGVGRGRIDAAKTLAFVLHLQPIRDGL